MKLINRIVFLFKGKYSPKRRLKIYLELLDRLRELHDNNNSLFMCYILRWNMGIKIDY